MFESFQGKNEMESDELVKDGIYKVFSRSDNGKIVYTAARYDGVDKKGSKFNIVSMSTPKDVVLDKEEMNDLIFLKSSWKVKDKNK